MPLSVGQCPPVRRRASAAYKPMIFRCASPRPPQLSLLLASGSGACTHRIFLSSHPVPVPANIQEQVEHSTAPGPGQPRWSTASTRHNIKHLPPISTPHVARLNSTQFSHKRRDGPDLHGSVAMGKRKKSSRQPQGPRRVMRPSCEDGERPVSLQRPSLFF